MLVNFYWITKKILFLANNKFVTNSFFNWMIYQQELYEILYEKYKQETFAKYELNSIYLVKL